jgi:general nucleoside transport system permease protein
MNSHFFAQLLVVTVALATPLLLAALGELISETAGVINIELEGMMLCGAFTAVWAAHSTSSVVLGFLAAAVGGLFLATIHGVLCLFFRANQVVSGIVLNIFALGLTSFLLATALGPTTSPVPTLHAVRIPVLADIPGVGKAFFAQNVMVYAAYLLIPCVWFLLNRSPLGLALKAAGERPAAAESLGVRVTLTRSLALGVCGVFAGLGGGLLALAAIGFFTENMTAGRGFIALAAVIFGRWRTFGTAGAVVLFALADAFQIRLQALGIVDIAPQFLVMLPYLVTLVALAGLMRRMRPPSALGVNYLSN